MVADWHVIDASGEVLGRLASRIAWLLMGKHKPGYVPHLKSGDFVVVINAEKVRLTGKKRTQMVYRRHSQRPGNLKEIPYRTMQEKHPTRIIEHVVRGMLPKSKLGDRMYRCLKVYAGEAHPHAAQVIGSERRIQRLAEQAARQANEAVAVADAAAAATEEAPKRPARRRRRRTRTATEAAAVASAVSEEPAATVADADETPSPAPRRRRRRRTRSSASAAAVAAGETVAAPAPVEEQPAETDGATTISDSPEADAAESRRISGTVSATENEPSGDAEPTQESGATGDKEKKESGDA